MNIKILDIAGNLSTITDVDETFEELCSKISKNKLLIFQGENKSAYIIDNIVLIQQTK